MSFTTVSPTEQRGSPHAASPTDGSTVPEPSEGAVLKGRYRLDSKIGEGGMGVVYRATDLEAIIYNRDSSTVAVKMIKGSLRDRPESIAALFEEVEQTRKLQQDNIVNVFAFEQHYQNAFMVMEFLTGKSLDRLIANEYALGMPFALAWPIINGMGQALAYAHRHGIIHSDFKPSNVFVTAAGAKVLDFGIARAAQSAISPGSKLAGLTPAYASCEMFEFMPPDTRDDVFAFGIVIYELLSGKHPFQGLRSIDARDQGKTVSPIRGLTRRQNDALRSALAFDKFERTPSAQEVLDELWRGAKGPGRAVLLVMIGVLLVVIASIGGYIAYQHFGPQDSDQKFIEKLVLAGAPLAAGADEQTVRDLLDQGHDFLAEEQKHFDAGILSENVSSALGAFQAALTLDPANTVAAEGVLAVAKAYKSEAKRLYAAGQFSEARQMTAIALRIWPDSVDIKNLDRKIQDQLSTRPSERN